LIVENTELLVGDVEAALLDALDHLPPAGLDAELTRWEKENPLVRTAFRCSESGRILWPDATVTTEEAQAFRRRFSPGLERNPPWRTAVRFEAQQLAESVANQKKGQASEAENAVRQQAYTNVAKLQSARSDAKTFASSRTGLAREAAAASPVSSADAAADAAGDSGRARRSAKDEAGADRRGWVPWVSDGRLHLLGWIERPGVGEVRGVEVEMSALISRLGGALPAEVVEGEGYALRDDKGRIMHQAGTIPRDRTAPDARVAFAGTSLPGWEAVAFLAPAAASFGIGSGFFLVDSLLVGILVVAILAGGALLVGQARRSAAEAAQKTSFVGNVSHEFKTPLTTIRLYAELLEQGRVPDDEKRRDYLQTIGRETERLARLVGNALDFSRLEQGQKKYARERFDLGAALNCLLDTHEPRLRESGLKMGRAIPETPVELESDRDAIEQIVLNLLDNAAKYAAGGGEVLVEAKPRAAGGAMVRVLDRGPGIPAAHREKVFEKFHRVDDALTAEKGGAGLGLSIGRQLARGLGGELRHEPRDGGGVVFVLELP